MHVARLVWSPELLEYDFGRGHPMAPARLDLTMRLVRSLGLLDAPGLEVAEAPPADDDLVRTVHDADYVEAVHRAGGELVPDRERGLGIDDNPVFRGMDDAAARQLGGSVALADAVWSGEVQHGVNVAGGMHHAMRAAASGFCVYNDAAGAIQRLLDAGAERVAYVDLDAHHGDGVEAIFWDDPRVLTVSVHEEGRTLFPGTGHPTDTGGAGLAEGTAVNVALPARTDGGGWLRAVDAVVLPVVRAFAPQALVSQHGCDAHGLDPLTHLDVDVDAQRTAAEWVHRLAHDLAGGRWIALGGGGYAVVDVVPLTWAALVAEAAHAPLPRGLPLPREWREAARALTGLEPTATLGTAEPSWRPWRDGFDPADPVDRAIAATRKAVFPVLGLDVHLD